MTCPSCQKDNQSGKFCGSCGTPLSAAATETAASYAAGPSTQQTEVINRAKGASKQYGNYALQLLKKPSEAFDKSDQQFVQGLSTLVIYLVTFALSLFFLFNSLFKKAQSSFGSYMEGLAPESLPFFKITWPLFLNTTFIVLAAVISTLAVARIISASFSVKGLITQFGSLLVPFAALNVLGMLAGLAGSIKFTLILGSISLLFPVLLYPALIIYEYALKSEAPIKRVYWSLGATLFTVFLIYLEINLFIRDKVQEYERMLNML
ncbi:zinc ribbon domain-containing protein [Pontibacillus salipaludis]|uniref:zinc ribbon domain-containing protein n=1 Tax=Pontibacillus salipaludis TaxID=1697394 RepID=UPI0031E742A6